MKKVTKWIIGVLVCLLALVTFCKLLSIIPAHMTMRRIKHAFPGANRITIRGGHMFDGPSPVGSTLADVTNQNEIAEFFSALQVQPSFVQLFCMQCACGGDLEVHISQQDAEPFKFTIHHGQSIRIPGTVTSDAVLKPGSAYRLARWLCRHGVYEEKEKVQQNESTVSSEGTPWEEP